MSRRLRHQSRPHLQPHGLPFWVVAPEFLAVSDWERHALVADLRGSFTGYGGTLPATDRWRRQSRRRPMSTGRTSPAMSTAASTSPMTSTSPRRRGCASPPTIPAARTSRRGWRAIRVYATFGGTFGFDQQLQPPAGVRRRHRRPHRLPELHADRRHDARNDDRNFNQYGGVGRVSYEVLPGAEAVRRGRGRHAACMICSSTATAIQRDSNGGYVKAGTSFEFTRLLTGEVAVGWAERNYADPRLNRLAGPAHLGLAGLDRDAADDGEVHRRHPDRRDHAARRLGRAGAYLHLRGRSRLPPLAHGDRQVHLRHLRLSGRRPQRQDATRSRATSSTR